MEEPRNEMDVRDPGAAEELGETATAGEITAAAGAGEAEYDAAEDEEAGSDEFIRIDGQPLEQILEALLLASDEPLSIDRIQNVLGEEAPPRAHIRVALKRLGSAFDVCSYELKETASGFRLQVGERYARWVGRLREERPARYSRALLETLALIAYRQPITRGEIEEVRGVAVGTQIIRTLEEREWIRVVGQKDVPGRPSLYATTRKFLDYFNLKSLSELPTLEEIRDFETVAAELEAGAGVAPAPEEAASDGLMDASVEVAVQPDGDMEEPAQAEPAADGDALLESIPVPDVTH